MAEISGYCGHCRRYRLARREDTNHILHLLVSVFLCGLWLPFWMLIAFVDQFKDYRCTRCGGPVQ